MRRINTLDIEAHLADIAKDQLGLITANQAAKRGIICDSLEERVRHKTLFRVHSGVYRVAAVPESELQSTLAGWLAVSKTRVAIAKGSAARIHGLPIGNQTQDVVELVCFGDERARVPGIKLRRTITKPETQGWHGARITSVSQTVCDLAAELDRDTLARCVDHVIAHRIATVASIHQIVLARPAAGFKGRALLVELLNDRPDGRPKHRSKLEQRAENGFVRRVWVTSFRTS